MTNKIELQQASSAPSPDEKQLQAWLAQCLELLGETGSEVVIRMVDDKESQALNEHYRQKNSPTNVLAFPAEIDGLPDAVLADLESRPLGDIVICASVVNREVDEQGKSRDAHWAHMLVHGCLHLLGYDHINNADAKTMEDLEVRILENLGFSSPY